MYTTLPAFILGFHGCDQSVVDKVVNGDIEMWHSKNDYDWLGHGIYFWENDLQRALEFAKILKDHPMSGPSKIIKPAVIGAVIDLGHCLNLLEAEALESVRSAYDGLRLLHVSTGISLPTNKPGRDGGNDLRLRYLDCAVIQLLHKMNDEHERSIDTVRGLFFEGEELYPNAGFKARNHIQICVRNPNCIKGYFLPRTPDSQHPIP